MELRINQKSVQVDADADTPLLWVLRDDLGMTGTKYGCGLAQCGAARCWWTATSCVPVSPPWPAWSGARSPPSKRSRPTPVGKRVVAAWVEHQVAQCGYCQSGQVMAATALLKHTPRPSDEQISAAMVNLCRCGTYNAIHAAVHALAQGEQA
jgi:Aerobic-type carbon monoxide dehydrogenase, small subunit CoxS/CutS homologs